MSFDAQVGLAIAAALCLIPTLVAGAISDVKTRTFPKKYWGWWSVPLGGICTILLYLLFLSDGMWPLVALLGVTSVLLAGIFYFIGIRYGSGGDWRALIYIAVITPWSIFETILISLAVAFLLAIYEMCKPGGETPLAFRSIPFTLAIAIGFILATLWFAFAATHLLL